jgi:Sec-independent protein secretion pathway component TatC
VEFPRLKRVLDRTQAAAEYHRNKVRRYGVVGLYLFVWIPFWMTGPVVGSAIGYLLGFPAWLTILVVLAGTYTAIAAWAYLLFDIYTRAAAFGPWAPILIIVLIILMIVASKWLNRYGKKHNSTESE